MWQPNAMFHAWMAQRRPWQQQQQQQGQWQPPWQRRQQPMPDTLMSPNPTTPMPQMPPGINTTFNQQPAPQDPMALLGIPQANNKWGGV